MYVNNTCMHTCMYVYIHGIHHGLYRPMAMHSYSMQARVAAPLSGRCEHMPAVRATLPNRWQPSRRLAWRPGMHVPEHVSGAPS